MLGEPLPEAFEVPQPRMPREVQQEQFTRDIEIDPKKYLPEDVYRDPLIKLPDPMTMNIKAMARGAKPKKDE